MQIEVFNIHKEKDREKYYPILCKWWVDWKWPPVHWHYLSTTGVMIKSGDEYLCAGWMYQTDSLMCVSDFFISTREKIDRQLRKDALKLVIKSIEGISKNKGFKTVYTSVKNRSLIKTLIELDYGKDSTTGKGDEDMTVFIKKI